MVFYFGGFVNVGFFFVGGGFVSCFFLLVGFFLQQVIYGNIEIFGDFGNFCLGVFYCVDMFFFEFFFSLFDQFFQFCDRKIVEIDSYFWWFLIDRVGFVWEIVVIIRKKCNYVFGIFVCLLG